MNPSQVPAAASSSSLWYFFLYTSALAEALSCTGLLVIDMHKDFVDDPNPIRVNGGKAIVPNIVEAVRVCRTHRALVVWVVRENDPLGREVEHFRRHSYALGKPVAAVKGSAGAELVEGLVIEPGDYKLFKTWFSAFFNTHLHSVLQALGIDSVVVAGVQTPNCIRQTVVDAVALDYKSITVLADVTAAATPEIHTANMADMRNLGVAIKTLQEWSH